MASQRRRLVRLVDSLVVTLACYGAAEALAPGTRIDPSNWAQVADLLPAPVLRWVEKGDLPLVLGEMRDEVSWEAPFLEASAANDGRYDVDEEGGLVDAISRERPEHTYGFPFPRISREDPKSGIKVMWNVTMTTYKFGRLHGQFALHWIGPHGFERLVKGHAFVLAFDYQPTPLPNPDRTETRDIFEGLSPASANGIATLTWRYLDNRPDSVWGYLPAMRRIRQLTAANRSDPLFGSDFVQDDALLWAGKTQSFAWRLTGAQDVLVGTAATEYVQLVPGVTSAHGQEWLSPKTFAGAHFGWETDGWTGAPWAPTNLVWVKRPVWVVEGQPKDRYYSYGRQVFYVDRATFKIYYKVIYTPAGEYWKTIFNDLGIGIATDGHRQVIAAAFVAVDDRTHHASYTRGQAPDMISEYNSPLAVPELFTVNGLMRLGK